MSQDFQSIQADKLTRGLITPQREVVKNAYVRNSDTVSQLLSEKASQKLLQQQSEVSIETKSFKISPSNGERSTSSFNFDKMKLQREKDM